MVQLDTLLLTKAHTEQTLSKLRGAFKTVHYYPDPKQPIPEDVLSSTEFFFVHHAGFHSSIKSLDALPKLKHIQLHSAGANGVLNSDVMRKYLDKGGDGITLATASGTHVLSIPNHVVAMVITLFHQLHTQIIFGRKEKRWGQPEELDGSGEGIYARKSYGRTVGFLGYGALGRESARLLKAHGMRIVAANTSGKATADEGYIIPGTGDKDGALPEKYFSTKDPKSLEAFLNECDVLVTSLPDTPQTRYILDAKKLAMLKPNALLINVGRGSLARSEDILTALDAKDGLFGAALDVTDPEPLPQDHPLWSHPKVVITPHTSGETECEFDIAADIAIANAEKLRNGEKPHNLVDYKRGY